MAVENLRRSLSTDSERKYQLISKTSIRLFADSRGYTVSDDVVRLLTEDVNYRLREVVSEASQYMKRSAHSYMRVSDVNHALTDANVSHIYPRTQSNYVYLPSHKIYTPSDSSIDLSSVVTSELTPSPTPILSHDSVSLQPTSASPLDSATRHVLSQYFTSITQAISGNDRQLRKVALADVIHNTRVGHVQQQLLQFIQKWVNASLKARRSMHHPLELLDGLTSNRSLHFSRLQVDTVTDTLVDSVCLGQAYGDVLKQLAQQQYASSILCKFLRGSAIGQQVQTDILTRCKAIVQRSAESFPTTPLIGALAIILSLQPMVLAELNAVIDKLLDQTSKRTDRQTALVTSLLIDGMNCMLKRAESSDDELSAVELGRILSYATVVQRHLPDQCVCRLPLPADESQLDELSQHSRQYLKRTLPGEACRASVSHSQCFKRFKPVVRSCDWVKLNYGVVKENIKRSSLSRRRPVPTLTTQTSDSQAIYQAWETLRHVKVMKRSSQKVPSAPSMLFMTL